MKKTICFLLLAALLCTGLAGCKSDALPGDNTTNGVIGEEKTTKETKKSTTQTQKNNNNEKSGETSFDLQEDPATAPGIEQEKDPSNGKVKTYSETINEDSNATGNNADQKQNSKTGTGDMTGSSSSMGSAVR